MQKYFLMHKDDVCGDIVFDDDGRIITYKDKNTGLSPFLGNADEAKIKKWWKTRSVPASRSIIQNLLRGPDGTTAEQYLEKNLALSMTDSYWICPYGMDISYDQVKFSNLSGYNAGKIPYHNATSYDPNASLGGQMEKYWDLTCDTPELVKESIKYYGQQAINEVFATRFHEIIGVGISFVRYTASKAEGGGILCRCQSFTSDSAELVSAYEVIESRKCPNDKSLYNHYADICQEYGISIDAIQKFLDYQTATDFIISNTDEHLLNFGVLRDPVTMRFLAPAPIFDSGNSMYYSEGTGCRYTRAGLLGRPITAVKKTEEGMLGLIRDKNIVPAEMLPSSDYVRDFYTKGGLPEEKADSIAHNYRLKVEMYQDFQRGIKISLHTEKTKERSLQKRENAQRGGISFHMLCGLPGSGKTEKAKEIMERLFESGLAKKDSEELYPVLRCIEENAILIDEAKTLANVTAIEEYKDSCVLVSANGIRDEMRKSAGYVDNVIVFLVAKARIKTAIMSGASVVFDATNADRRTRMDYLEMVKRLSPVHAELHIRPFPEKIPPEIPGHVIKEMTERIVTSIPFENEGWDKIETSGLSIQDLGYDMNLCITEEDGYEWDDFM